MSRPDSVIIYSEDNILGYDVGLVYSGERYCNIRFFFISSQSPPILHLHSSDSSGLGLRYRIISYNYNELKLDTFDGKGHLIYKRDSLPDNSSGETGNSITGDVNGDGLINMMDVTEIINTILGK